jgi:hypothetical protein
MSLTGLNLEMYIFHFEARGFYLNDCLRKNHKNLEKTQKSRKIRFFPTFSMCVVKNFWWAGDGEGADREEEVNFEYAAAKRDGQAQGRLSNFKASYVCVCELYKNPNSKIFDYCF